MKVIKKSLLKIKSKSLLTDKENFTFLKELSFFLTEGYSLRESLSFLKQTYNIIPVIRKLESGYTFSESISILKIKSEIILLIQINEAQGNLTKGIHDAIELWQLNKNVKQQFQEQIRYPLFLIIVVLAILLGINELIIPQVINLYENFNLDLTFQNQMVIYVLKALPYGILLLLLVIVGFIFFNRYVNLEQKIKILTKLKLGNLYLRIYNQIFITYFISMSEMGLNLEAILKLLSKQRVNMLLRVEALRILNALNQGIMLEDALKYRYYTKECQQLFQIGLANDNLLRYLKMDLLQKQLIQTKRKKQILFWLQPVIYLFIGGVIIVIYSLIFNTIYGVLT